jgi:ABC-2 type transport system ATP-binding protein
MPAATAPHDPHAPHTSQGSLADLAIDLAEVAKTYRGRVHALRGVSMRVHRGEIFGLLGPNGAGKSTLVKILMTVVRPTRCRGNLLGRPVGAKPTLARVGYLPEHHRFPEYLTARQVCHHFAALSGIDRPTRRASTNRLLDLVGLQDWADKRVKSFSKGMRQRLGIAQSLVNDPELVLLDEPTDGVDPVGRRDIRNLLSHLKDQGKTVFLNSHLLSELEMVCDRVAIMVQGLVTSQGTIDELTVDQQRYEIELAAASDPEAAALLTGAIPGLAALPPAAQDASAGALAKRVGARGTLSTGEWAEIDRHTLRIGTPEPQRVQWVIDALRARGATIKSVRQVRPSLEDLFMQAVVDPTTGKELAPGAAMPAKRKRGGGEGRGGGSGGGVNGERGAGA